MRKFVPSLFSVIFFLGATFVWIVLIEHGLDDFVRGAMIELANLGDLCSRLLNSSRN